ncbi:hypothetical protein BJY52DRAFT_1314864 [Lactarius psammicola]|nr:hypothetical protein BJY52DRAFT_1314864 [Lactarius psammicola]
MASSGPRNSRDKRAGRSRNSRKPANKPQLQPPFSRSIVCTPLRLAVGHAFTADYTRQVKKEDRTLSDTLCQCGASTNSILSKSRCNAAFVNVLRLSSRQPSYLLHCHLLPFPGNDHPNTPSSLTTDALASDAWREGRTTATPHHALALQKLPVRSGRISLQLMLFLQRERCILIMSARVRQTAYFVRAGATRALIEHEFGAFRAREGAFKHISTRKHFPYPSPARRLQGETWLRRGLGTPQELARFRNFWEGMVHGRVSIMSW